MILIQITPESLWYGACFRFKTGATAREAWVAVHAAAPKDGAWHVGVYRHQRIGKDKEPVLVSVVGNKREGVASAEAFLCELDCEEIDLHSETWVALVKRRVQKMNELIEQGAGGGRHVIPHPPEGDMIT